MPLPPPLLPKPPDELAPRDPLLEPVEPRAPEETEPELRAAVEEPTAATELVLLPAEAALTTPATDAPLAVAALTRALFSAADLAVAAVPPPVPEAWPETALRADCNAVLRDVVSAAVGPDRP